MWNKIKGIANVYREFFSFVYFLVKWHAGAVNLLMGDVIFAQQALPLNDVNFCLHLE